MNVVFESCPPCRHGDNLRPLSSVMHSTRTVQTASHSQSPLGKSFSSRQDPLCTHLTPPMAVFDLGYGAKQP